LRRELGSLDKGIEPVQIFPSSMGVPIVLQNTWPVSRPRDPANAWCFSIEMSPGMGVPKHPIYLESAQFLVLSKTYKVKSPQVLAPGP
jgi:hypothetical protein